MSLVEVPTLTKSGVQAITKMVQRTMEFIDKTPDQKTKLELIETLRAVTEGKVQDRNSQL